MLPPALVAPRLCFGCSLEALLDFAPAAEEGHSHRHQQSDSHSSIDTWTGSVSQDASSIGDRSSDSGSAGGASISSGSGDSGSTSSGGVGSNVSTGSGAAGNVNSSNSNSSSSNGGDISPGGILAALLPISGASVSDCSAAAAALLDVYRDDGYVLTWRGGAGRAMLREDASPTAPVQVTCVLSLETGEFCHSISQDTVEHVFLMWLSNAGRAMLRKHVPLTAPLEAGSARQELHQAACWCWRCGAVRTCRCKVAAAGETFLRSWLLFFT